MRQFILIDHSLQDLGGHHFPYAHNILTAAAAAGWKPVLATHQSFARREAFDPTWQVVPVFAHGSYSRHTLDTQSPHRSWRWQESPAPWHRLRSALIARARDALASAFAAGCAQLFAQVPLNEGDVVFIGTASELDLAGLSRFLQQTIVPARIHWHLQFHFGLFRGRPAGHAQQSAALAAMRDAFRSALAPIGGHELHFYCTTDALCAQYRALGTGTFETLPYPVHEFFSSRRRLRLNPLPAMVACLGHGRREKGYDLLPELLRALWAEYFLPGRARLVLQAQRKRQRRQLQGIADTLRRVAGPMTAADPMTYAPSPLDLPGYAQLVCDSDLGLLLYDGERYYDRCSGVLLEMQVAGVPVVVPAGSWLAEQIAPANQLHLETLESQANTNGSLLPIASPGSGDGRQFSLQQSLAEFECGEGIGTLLLRFDWVAPEEPGSYLRVELTERTQSGQVLRRTAQVAARNRDGGPVRMAFRLQAAARKLELSAGSAWDGAPIAIADVSLAGLRGAPVPLGSVGLTIADPGEAPAAISDILDHIAHYKQHAATWAMRCAEQHSGSRVVERIALNSTSSRTRSA